MDDMLMHYGVKGMKWGVRRTPAQLGHKVKRKKISESVSEGVAKAKQIAAKAGSMARDGAKAISGQKKEDSRKAIRKLSAEELQARINRLNTEKRYRDLLAERKNAEKSAAQKFVESQFGNLMTKAANKAVSKMVDKMFAEKEATSVLDMKKLDKYTDKQIEAAKRRKDNIRDLEKNWEKVKDTDSAAFYGKIGREAVAQVFKQVTKEENE